MLISRKLQISWWTWVKPSPRLIGQWLFIFDSFSASCCKSFWWLSRGRHERYSTKFWKFGYRCLPDNRKIWKFGYRWVPGTRQIIEIGYRWVPGAEQILKVGYCRVLGTEQILEVGYRWVPGTEQISEVGYRAVFETWVPLGTGCRENSKNSSAYP